MLFRSEGTQEGPKKCVPPSRWACRSRPQPPAARHSPFPSWAPWCLDANTPCQRGLGAKGCAESVPPSVPLRERRQSGTSPGPRASCAVFRSVGVSHAAMTDFATPRTVAHKTPLSTGFSRQEYWSGLPFPSTGDLPNPGIKRLLHCRRILYHLSHQGSPGTLQAWWIKNKHLGT